MATSRTQSPATPPIQHSSPPGHQAFVPACPGATSLPLPPQQAPRGSGTSRDLIGDQYALLSPALSLPGSPQGAAGRPLSARAALVVVGPLREK